MIELSDGGVLSLRLDSIDEPAPIPIADARARLEQDWTAAQVKSRLMELAEKLKPGLETGGDLAVLGLELMPVDGITRASFIEDLPPFAIQEVFGLDTGGVAIVDAREQVLMVRLTNITPFDPDLDGNEAILARIKAQLDSQIAVDVLEYFADALQSEAGVTLAGFHTTALP